MAKVASMLYKVGIRVFVGSHPNALMLPVLGKRENKLAKHLMGLKMRRGKKVLVAIPVEGDAYTIYYSDIMGPKMCSEFFLPSYLPNPVS